MCKKKDVGIGIGVILGVGAAAVGVYLAKKYIDKRKRLLKNYDVEVDRLQNEVDFDYSEEFLKELKKETLQSEKKQYNKAEIKKTLADSKQAVNEQIKKLEIVIKEHLKKEAAAEALESEQAVMDGFEDDVPANEIVAEESDFEENAENKND